MLRFAQARDTVTTLHLQVNFSKNELLQKVCNGKNTDVCVKSLFDLTSGLKGMEMVAGRTQEQTATALSFILPYIEISLMSNVIANECYNPGERLNYITSGKWEEVALSSDRFSAKLKQATFLHMLGHHQASLDILLKLEILCEPTVTSICPCRGLPIQRSKTPEAEKGHNDEDKGRFYQTAFAPCIVFLPTERMIVPEALRYEMMRSSGMLENSRNKRLEYWFDWAVVDSKIVLYFILYLNHSKLGDDSKKRSAIERLTELIKTDDTIVHKETALNLFGWAFKQERCMEKAAVCFEASLQLHETHNAAAQHIKDLKADSEDEPTVIYSRKDNKL